MSLFTDGQTSIFPLAFIKDCIEKYTEDHGQAPKILVLAQEDFLDYSLNCTIAQVQQLGLKVICGSYLKSGEFDLALGIKDE